MGDTKKMTRVMEQFRTVVHLNFLIATDVAVVESMLMILIWLSTMIFHRTMNIIFTV